VSQYYRLQRRHLSALDVHNACQTRLVLHARSHPDTLCPDPHSAGCPVCVQYIWTICVRHDRQEPSAERRTLVHYQELRCCFGQEEHRVLQTSKSQLRGDAVSLVSSLHTR
jgi:hypothetical protein